MNNNTRDWVGQWFEIYEELNEPADIQLIVEIDGRTDVVNYPHKLGDGASALFSLSEKYGWSLNNVLPGKNPPPISIFRYLKTIALFPYWTRSRPKNIWPFKFAKADTAHTFSVSYRLNERETRDLINEAENRDVSLNSLLFYALNRVFEEKFSSHPRAWWIPVNMRRDLGVDPNDSSIRKNFVANFTVDVEKSMSLQQLAALLKTLLKDQRHWGTWWWQMLGRWLPHRLIKKIAESKLYSDCYAGTFTNPGRWECSEKSAHVTLLAPAMLSHPIGASALIWNANLNLGLRFYGTLPLDEIQRDRFMRAWVEELLLLLKV